MVSCPLQVHCSFLLQLHLPPGKGGFRAAWRTNLHPCVNCRYTAMFYLTQDPSSARPHISRSAMFFFIGHEIFCPLLQSQWLEQFPRHLLLGLVTVISTAQAVNTKLVFQSLLSCTLAPSVSRQSPPPCTGLPLDLGRNTWRHETNLVPKCCMKARKGQNTNHGEFTWSVHGQRGKFKPTRCLCKWVIVKIKWNASAICDS